MFGTKWQSVIVVGQSYVIQSASCPDACDCVPVLRARRYARRTRLLIPPLVITHYGCGVHAFLKRDREQVSDVWI